MCEQIQSVLSFGWKKHKVWNLVSAELYVLQPHQSGRSKDFLTSSSFFPLPVCICRCFFSQQCVLRSALSPHAEASTSLMSCRCTSCWRIAVTHITQNGAGVLMCLGQQIEYSAYVVPAFLLTIQIIFDEVKNNTHTHISTKTHPSMPTHLQFHNHWCTQVHWL